MPHYINAPPGSSAFREQFIAVREGFIARFTEIAAREHIERFLVCDLHGRLVDWVWDHETFKPKGNVGGLKDARSFLAHMINQGMHVGCIVVDRDGQPEMWLAAWEPPTDAPPWPSDLPGRNEIIHDGVRISSGQ